MSWSDPTSLFLSFFIGLVGFGIFLYGKKQARAPQLLVGIAMMIYPYFVPRPLWMGAIAAGLCISLYAATRFGL